MRLTTPTLAILGLAGMTLTACSKDDAAATGIELRMEIDKSVLNYRSAGDLQFTDGHIRIREVVFDGDRVGGESVSISHERVVTFDFATGLGDPADQVIEIPAGEYRSVYLGIELQDENNDPSLVVTGTYEKADGVAYPIRFEFNSGEVFEAEAATATVDPGTTAISRITFDPHAWFRPVSYDRLENASVNADGVIVVSEISNAAIFDLVADGLDMSTEAVFD